MAAWLDMVLSMDPKLKQRSLVAPSGRCAQFEGETFKHFETTHFSNLEVTEKMSAPAAAFRARYCDWRVDARVVRYIGVEWAIHSFALYISPGMDGIFPAMLQEEWSVVPYLVRIFHACLSTGYVSAMWWQVKVVLIPKPDRNSHSRPKDFRPISLTSFLLKTMERLVDRYLREEVLALLPLHPNQHAYRAAKSVEMALHQLMVWV